MWLLIHVGIKVNPCHDDVIKWKHFPRYWPFVWEIHRTQVNSPHKGWEWCRALMFSLICAWINDWVNNREAGDWRRYRTHHDVTVMLLKGLSIVKSVITWHCIFIYLQSTVCTKMIFGLYNSHHIDQQASLIDHTECLLSVPPIYNAYSATTMNIKIDHT